ncbi:MAG: hypothetical protein ACE5FI_07440, partial [Anaerolineales bacterium]
ALLVQLAERGQRFALVSTRPAGVGVAQAVAEAALARVEIDAAETYGVQYVNLGLIPGGAIGLQAFAADPVSVIDVDFIRGDSPWGMDVVAGVDSLSGFDMMVVATDSPAVGRGWLEQVRPQGVPMAAVVTGATQPLLQPYAEGDNPQFVGLSGGLAGAFVNDIIAPRGPSAVSRRWDSYSAGILAAGLLLLFGNVVWMTVRLARPESRSESSPGGTQL